MRASSLWGLWSTEATLVVDSDAERLPRGIRDVDDLRDAAVEIADRELALVDAAVNRFRGDSEINRIASDLPRGVSISALLTEYVGAALDAARLTEGAVDPTLGRHLSALGYDRDIALVLDDDDRPVRAVATDVAGWQRVELRGRRLRVPADRTLDLGATAKALAADRVAATIAARLDCSVLLSLGGDVSTAGPEPRDGWHVRVQDLPDEPATTVRVAAGHAVATSSTLRRRWRRGGETMHHILDPRTGLPADPVWRTVTVAASRCVLANAYATAAIVRGASALEWLADRAPARLVDQQCRVHTVGGWPAEPVPAHATGEAMIRG
ncbi:FAD:protein FMN transferase [Microbacterium sp. RURRCA19A]|uniref:FAD:protein FMN transferase n=1 Tax=Microbacterium sp. RURRCA19A TaxID=1907391 RepID=UPI0009566FD4|nr:FAD:protein FMN transferase [Microbacterium sp. RURRCA19A]SIS11268.1 thiamine biosynthesis lipoprotein [Microbacterium sp. RURRCA19A]